RSGFKGRKVPLRTRSWQSWSYSCGEPSHRTTASGRHNSSTCLIQGSSKGFSRLSSGSVPALMGVLLQKCAHCHGFPNQCAVAAMTDDASGLASGSRCTFGSRRFDRDTGGLLAHRCRTVIAEGWDRGMGVNLSLEYPGYRIENTPP